MGLFDSLYVTLPCPKTGLEREVEIQFKFGDPCVNRYHLGDQLDEGPYGNLWIPEEYGCDQCSTEEPAPAGSPLPTRRNAVWHKVFIHLHQGKFLEVFSDEEFKREYVKEGKPDLPKGQALWIPWTQYDKPLFEK